MHNGPDGGVSANDGARRPAKRSLSQNFLTDPNLRRKIVGELEAGPEDAVLEIGPGHGELSTLLVDRVAQLVLVEKDDGLAEELRHGFAGHAAVAVVHGDALRLDLSALLEPGRPSRVLSNLPYAITTPLLFRILAMRPPPARVVVTVQQEVANRIVASPGSKEYGALSVGVQVRGTARIALRIGRKAFRPVPRVDSATVVVEPASPPLDSADEAALRQVTRVLFRGRRKQLQKILRTSPEYRLTAAAVDALAARLGLDPWARPEVLSPSEILGLARALSSEVEKRRGHG